MAPASLSDPVRMSVDVNNSDINRSINSCINFENKNVFEILTSLTSKSHLERDRAMRAIQVVLPVTTPSEKEQIRSISLSRLDESSEWYVIHSTSVSLCHYMNLCMSNSMAQDDNETFIHLLQGKVNFLISHPEARVRESSTSYIASLCQIDPVSTFHSLYPLLLQRVEETFEMDVHQRTQEAAKIAARDVNDNQAASSKQRHNLIHETEGWKGLETIFLCISSLFTNSVDAKKNLDEIEKIIEFIKKSNLHPNRFVREAGFKLLNSCIKNVNPSELKQFIHMIITPLQLGLQDNWSQVRFNSSICVRSIVLTLPYDDFRDFFPILLPRMCLNRHYVAEGVRNFSHETWKILFAEKSGKSELVQIMKHVVDYFEAQISADNHAVREAACQSFEEIIVKLDEKAVNPYVYQILNALLNGFKDESWPVRDWACSAVSQVINKYSTTIDNGKLMNEIKDLFVNHLSDNILSVRKNCANAFVKACYNFDETDDIMGFLSLKLVIRNHLDSLKDQKNDVNSEVQLNKMSNTQFGASTKIAHDHRPHHQHSNPHDDAVTNQTMFSCGSLAPKLRRGGGCCDHGFVRPREPWEITEAGILLWCSLATQGGSKGALLANELLKEIVAKGVEVSVKPFRSRTKLMVTLLECMTNVFETSGVKVDIEDEELMLNIAKILLVAKQDRSSHAIKEYTSTCRRLVMRMVGLRRMGELEYSARSV